MWIQVQKYWNDKSINSTLSKSKYLYHIYNHINISMKNGSMNIESQIMC